MWCGEVAFIWKVHATLRQIADRIPTIITKFVGNSSELLNGQIFPRNFVGNASDFYNGQIPTSKFCRNPNGQYGVGIFSSLCRRNGRRNIFVWRNRRTWRPSEWPSECGVFSCSVFMLPPVKRHFQKYILH